MLYIPYNPQSDPWYQFGNAVANGLGLLADNRMARGEAKNFNSELANDQANKMQGLFNQVQSMGNIDANDDTGWNEANAKLGAMGYSGPKLTRDNREQIQNGLLNQWSGLNLAKYRLMYKKLLCKPQIVLVLTLTC